jgi:hypothetical protein
LAAPVETSLLLSDAAVGKVNPQQFAGKCEGHTDLLALLVLLPPTVKDGQEPSEPEAAPDDAAALVTAKL